MRSVFLFGILSFFVIFTVTFLITGVFKGVKTAWDERNEVDELAISAELGLERQSLQSQTEEISRREAQLIENEEALELEKAVLAEEFNKLNAMRTRIENAAGQMEANQQKSLRKLAKMYEAMPAQEAAQILSGMDVGIVLDVLRYMKERPAAKVMAALDPARAAVLSSMMSAKPGEGR
jgi:flagellar motility protein MotE (MotC chaperone)